MAREWFVKFEDRPRGPYWGSQIIRAAQVGQIAPETPVRKGDSGCWVRARDVLGLDFSGQILNESSNGRHTVLGTVVTDQLILDEFTPAIQENCNTGDAPGLPPNRRIVYALVHKAFEDYQEISSRSMWVVVAILFLLGVAGYVGVYMLMGMLYFFTWLTGLTFAAYGLYVFVLVIFATVWYVNHILDAWPVIFERERIATADKKRIRGLAIGRLESILDRNAFYSLALFVGSMIGVESGLIAFTPNHGFLAFQEPPSYASCTFYAIDHHCQNLISKFLEPRGIHAIGPYETSFTSNLIFFLFRISLEIMIAVFLLWAFWRIRIKQFFHTFPSHLDDWVVLAEWVEHLSRHSYRLPSRFHDEFVFIMLAEEYIRGNCALVYQVSRQFPRVNVNPEVVSLFVDDQGRQIFDNSVD